MKQFMLSLSRWLVAVGLIGTAALAGQVVTAAEPASSLIVCGASEVFIIPAVATGQEAPQRLWNWKAADSAAIDAKAHRTFASTDDCKPYEDEILITSSSGGVALVRRDDKTCRFYTYSRNAHSACLIPGNRVAVASSFGGDELQLFAIGTEPHQPEPLATLPLVGAHGAEWDADRQRIWALGDVELLLVAVREENGKVQLVAEKRWKLPTKGGHDLSPTADGRGYYVTTNTAVYRFDTETGTFTPHPSLAEHKKVKSIDEQRKGGRTVYHMGTPEHWWSDTLRFVGTDQVIRLPDHRLYKARWDEPRKKP